MATSTTSISTVSYIPTAKFFISPNTFSDPDVFAYLVDPSGDFYYGSLYVYHSYGRKKSPYTSTVDRGGVWGVESDGGLVNGYNIVYVYSYGRIISPDTSYDHIGDNRNFVIEWDGSIDGLNDPDVVSYGINKI